MDYLSERRRRRDKGLYLLDVFLGIIYVTKHAARGSDSERDRPAITREMFLRGVAAFRRYSVDYEQGAIDEIGAVEGVLSAVFSAPVSVGSGS